MECSKVYHEDMQLVLSWHEQQNLVIILLQEFQNSEKNIVIMVTNVANCVY